MLKITLVVHPVIMMIHFLVALVKFTLGFGVGGGVTGFSGYLRLKNAKNL